MSQDFELSAVLNELLYSRPGMPPLIARSVN